MAYFSKEHPFQTGEILQIAGIPSYRCEKIEEANGSAILLLDLNSDHFKALDTSEINFLKSYVREGGIVVASGIFANNSKAILELFGLKRFVPNKKHTWMHLKSTPFFLPYLSLPQERNYRLADRPGKLWSNELISAGAKTIASYEDGSSAITLYRFGRGYGIALALSLYDLRFRNLVARDQSANVHYINHYEPLSDFIILFIKSLYRQRLTKGFTLSTAQGSAKATLLVTHDVDFVDSIKNMKKFYMLERRFGVKATYNIWTKYLKDDKDVPFFTPKNIKSILNAQRLGFEIGSHTVEHTANFDKLPLGTCKESYPNYQPFSISYTEDSGNPTLCGEVKVSKELLLGAGVKEVISFRSGELLYNPHLPEVLERFAYRYSSCLSAEDVMSYFPYRYMYDFYSLKKPSKIWEFPLVYEDEKFPPLIFRLDQAKELLKILEKRGGVFTLLIHPDLTWWKLKNFDIDFLEHLLDSLPKGVKASTMAEFGRFWDLRDRIVWRYSKKEDGIEILLWSPEAMRIALLPFGWSGKLRGGKGVIWENSSIILECKKGWNRWLLQGLH